MKRVEKSESARSRLVRTGLFLSILLLGLLASGCNIPGSASSSSNGNAEAHQSTDMMTPKAIDVNSLESSIVLLRSPENPDKAIGSGVIVSDDGHLVTSHTVVDNPVEVVLSDGSTFRPALVTTDDSTGLALLKVPGDELNAVAFDGGDLTPGSEVFATGFDSASGTLGHMSGIVLSLDDDTSERDFPVNGPLLIDTDINLLDGFSGGALSDDEGEFNGILIPGESADGEQVFRAVSHWFVQAWLEQRQERLAQIVAEVDDWESIDLPSGWSLRQPDGWHANITADNGDGYRAELLPADPDVPLQITISVEENEYGTDAEHFVTEMFESRSSAQFWEISDRHGIPFTQITMTQEGALVDVAYYLDTENLIAISMTSSYHPQDDQAKVDEARALFEAVINSLHHDSL